MADLYRLHLRLVRPARVQVGRKGEFRFPAGRYAYIGSARGQLVARVRRHLRRTKRCHWHIDYLLAVADIEAVELFPDCPFSECELADRTAAWPHARRWPPRFGSSDCRCGGHLVCLGRE